MPVCIVCSLIFKDVKTFLTHLKFGHPEKCSSVYNCGEKNCFRSFPNLNSFKKHLKNHNNHDIESSLPDLKNVNSNELVKDHNKAHNDALVTENNCNIENNCSVEDTCEIFPEDEIEKFNQVLQANSLSFVSKFYASATFSRKDVQVIIDDVLELYREPMSIFQRNLREVLSNSNISSENKYKIDIFFSGFKNIFKGLSSEYYRFKTLEDSNFYIKPLEYVVGQRLDNINHGVVLPKTYTSQFIPLRHVLKKVFELPLILKETLQNIENLKMNNNFSNIIQGEFWKSKMRLRSENEKVFLPILIYFDEFECGNPLGSHAGIHKLGAVYCSVPCIPFRFQAQLENIFLCLLFHSSDLKEFGSTVVFSKLIDELIHLENEGILIQTPEHHIRIYFCLASLLGDNLGLNTLLGFTESFRANFYCRFCKCSRDEMEKIVSQKNEMMRNEVNYDVDVRMKNVTRTGIKEDCVWNKIDSFHVTQNYCVDIAHDIFEGVAHFDFIELIHQFIVVDKLFSLECLNDRLKCFDYGESSNKPPLISSENLKKKKINMSCAEMKTVILYAGLIFGNLVPVGNKYWEIYILLRKLLAIVLSDTVSQSKSDDLKELVEEHHSLYKRLFSLTLKPKHHFLTHYPDIMLKIGPLEHLSSLRYESKHRQSKLSANVMSSRVNITKTLAVKHQLQLCHRFISNRGFQNSITYNKVDAIHNINCIIPNFSKIPGVNEEIIRNFKDVYCCTSVTIGKVLYKLNDILNIERKDCPSFGKLTHILLNKENELCFVMTKIQILHFNAHLFAYEVEIMNTLTCISQVSFFVHVLLCKQPDEKYYITCF